MTIDLTHREHVDLSPEAFWRELVFSLEYQRRLYCEGLGFDSMEVLAHEGDPVRGLKRRLRFVKPLVAPAPITKLFGSHVTIDEIGEFDPRAQCWTYRMVPSILSDRIDIRGRVRVVPKGDAVEQISENSVTCRMFGLGSIIEPFVARSTEEGHADRTVFTRRYLAELARTKPLADAKPQP